MVIVAGHLIVAGELRDDYLAGCVDVVRQARSAPGKAAAYRRTSSILPVLTRDHWVHFP